MDLRTQLFQEILMARQRVYAVGEPTPLESASVSFDAEVFIKREDLSPIHSYKWRGAYNRMATLTSEERARGVVTASAGNHAQGVALAASRLGIRARIYMPVATPRMKQKAVALHGGEVVEVILHGDNFDAAAEKAWEDVRRTGSVFIHPYDDLGTMGGQGTLADEIVMSGQGPFDLAYVQIGGGGMCSAVACWLKTYYPKLKVIGVQGTNQASMIAAMDAGRPVTLPYVDVFCDGTAVKRVGENTYRLCKELVDGYITVTNEEVCAAIQLLWESRRIIAEPSGAMGLAGLLKDEERARGKRCLTILSGANMDFGLLAWVARHAGIGARRRRYVRFEIGERAGTMLALLDAAMEGINIIEFQYGKRHPERAWPVIGFEASPMELQTMYDRLRDLGVPHEDVTGQADVEFRIIPYEPSLFANPYFISFEFPERPGALHDFLDLFRGMASICYFNYTYTGEQVGRALMGFEFDSGQTRAKFVQILKESGHAYREIEQKVLDRVLKSNTS